MDPLTLGQWAYIDLATSKDTPDLRVPAIVFDGWIAVHYRWYSVDGDHGADRERVHITHVPTGYSVRAQCHGDVHDAAARALAALDARDYPVLRALSDPADMGAAGNEEGRDLTRHMKEADVAHIKRARIPEGTIVPTWSVPIRWEAQTTERVTIRARTAAEAQELAYEETDGTPEDVSWVDWDCHVGNPRRVD